MPQSRSRKDLLGRPLSIQSGKPKQNHDGMVPGNLNMRKLMHEMHETGEGHPKKGKRK